MKIMVVDDEQDILDLLKELFTKNKHEVSCSVSAKTALQMIDKDKPNVVLLDIKMPEIDGIKVLDEIKKKDPKIEVVMLTAYGYDDKLINECIKRGASGYISKNLPLQQIINTFNTLLKTMSL